MEIPSTILFHFEVFVVFFSYWFMFDILILFCLGDFFLRKTEKKNLKLDGLGSRKDLEEGKTMIKIYRMKIF